MVDSICSSCHAIHYKTDCYNNRALKMTLDTDQQYSSRMTELFQTTDSIEEHILLHRSRTGIPKAGVGIDLFLQNG